MTRVRGGGRNRMEIAREKQALRKRLLAKRSALGAAERERCSAQAARHLMSFAPLTQCRAILAYYPFRDEIDPRPFLAEALRRDQQVWLPLTDPAKRRLIPYRYEGEHMLRTGAYGIREPDPAIAARADLSLLDAVLLPGVAFDTSGGRLGYGGGYYDRFLPALTNRPLLIGLGFSLQVIERVPREAHDWPLDYLATEDGVIGPFA